MRAVVYHGPGRKAWEEVPTPGLQSATDAVVRVEAVTISGTDLGILRGQIGDVADGRILGHEAVGVIELVGSAVRIVRPGDRVLVSCITACGACRFCRDGRLGQCLGGGGWVLGRSIDGTQAEFVRVPFADTSTHLAPTGVPDDELLMLAEVFPTGYEVGAVNGRVHPGDVVVVVGAGPVGLAAVVGARLFNASHIIAVDHIDSRLEAAKFLGADVVIDVRRQQPAAVIDELTAGLGADVAIEAVGLPGTFALATHSIRPGGRVANIGAHDRSVMLGLDRLWLRNVTITTGLVDTSSIPTLLRLAVAGELDSRRLISHRFRLNDFMKAYDVFERAAETGALKVVLSRSGLR